MNCSMSLKKPTAVPAARASANIVRPEGKTVQRNHEENVMAAYNVSFHGSPCTEWTQGLNIGQFKGLPSAEEKGIAGGHGSARL